MNYTYFTYTNYTFTKNHLITVNTRNLYITNNLQTLHLKRIHLSIFTLVTPKTNIVNSIISLHNKQFLLKPIQTYTTINI